MWNHLKYRRQPSFSLDGAMTSTLSVPLSISKLSKPHVPDLPHYFQNTLSDAFFRYGTQEHVDFNTFNSEIFNVVYFRNPPSHRLRKKINISIYFIIIIT